MSIDYQMGGWFPEDVSEAVVYQDVQLRRYAVALVDWANVPLSVEYRDTLEESRELAQMYASSFNCQIKEV